MLSTEEFAATFARLRRHLRKLAESGTVEEKEVAGAIARELVPAAGQLTRLQQNLKEMLPPALNRRLEDNILRQDQLLEKVKEMAAAEKYPEIVVLLSGEWYRALAEAEQILREIKAAEADRIG